jgi:hypothetical protein
MSDDTIFDLARPLWFGGNVKRPFSALVAHSYHFFLDMLLLLWVEYLVA